MADSTDAGPRRDIPVPPGWCHWHGNTHPTSAVVLTIDSSSGPPHDQSACAACQARYGLTPLADLPDHGQHEHSNRWPQQQDDDQ